MNAVYQKMTEKTPQDLVNQKKTNSQFKKIKINTSKGELK